MLGSLWMLMPRGMNFFSLFEPYATLVVATAESLRAVLAGGQHFISSFRPWWIARMKPMRSHAR